MASPIFGDSTHKPHPEGTRDFISCAVHVFFLRSMVFQSIGVRTLVIIL